MANAGAGMTQSMNNIPGLSGWLAAQQERDQTSMSQLQQAGALQTLLANAEKQRQDQQLRQVLAQSGGDPERALAAALQSGNVAAAHQLEPIVEIKRKQQASQRLQGLDLNSLLDNPQAAMAAQIENPHIGPELERLRKVRENNAARATMQARPAIQPDPQEVAQAADDTSGQQAPAPVATQGQPGLFDSLSKSELPAIANQARTYQMQLQAPGNAAVPASHWMDLQKSLAADESKILERRQAADKARTASRVPTGYRMNADGSLERIPVVAGTKTSDDALTNDAWFQIINGKARPGSLPLGRDEGNRYREQLREKTAQIATTLGLSPERLATLGPENKAKFGALASVEKDLAAIRPFDDMLNTNAKIALDLAKKISSDRTNSQLLNKPITWLENNAMDNPDIAEYLFQIQTVKTEGARILNNPRLVGQLTDSARSEMGAIVNGNMPLGQTTRVLERMMADGKNRVTAIERESERLRADIRGSAGSVTPPPAPTQPAPATPTGTWSIKPVGG